MGTDREIANLNGVTTIPAITIAGQPYYGEMTADPIYDTICKSFHKDHKPTACMTTEEAMARIEEIDSMIKDAVAREEAQNRALDKQRGFQHHHAGFIVFLVIFFNVLLIFYCIRRNRKQNQDRMSSSVQEHVEKYFALQSTDDNNQ